LPNYTRARSISIRGISERGTGHQRIRERPFLPRSYNCAKFSIWATACSAWLRDHDGGSAAALSQYRGRQRERVSVCAGVINFICAAAADRPGVLLDAGARALSRSTWLRL
jgi:hypothetical protein